MDYEEPSYFREFYAAFAAGGVGFATGIANGWMNARIQKVTDMNNTLVLQGDYGNLNNLIWHDNAALALNAPEYFLLVSALNIGAVIASIPSGFFVDAIGRKATLLLLFGPYILGWLLVFASEGAVLLCIGRCVLGAAAAISAVVGPVYMAEVARTEVRGIVSGFFKLQMTMGQLAIYALTAFFSPSHTIQITVIAHFVFFALIICIPETPLFLVWSNQRKRAKKSFRWLRGKQYDVTVELKEIENSLQRMRVFDLEPAGFIKNLRRNSGIRALVISLSLVSTLQMSGATIISTFSTPIFESSSGGGWRPEIATVVMGIVYVLATLLSICIVDKYGRRLLLLISTAAIFVCYMVVGSYFYCQHKEIELPDGFKWVPFICLSTALVMFALGIGTVPWTMISELFPPSLKGQTTAIAMFVFWLVGGLVNISGIILKRLLGFGFTFWTFGIFQLFGFIFIYFVVPETRGKSTAEILKMLAHKRLH